ncbi:MAG: ParB/RepB/Spo0J family partition protein [Clostridia bacterium]|nr:ParB/RepB/Spo0J family partition protein [Clostridia bacterium]
MAKRPEIELPSVDELLKFSTNKGKAETVVILNPYDITDFPDHPFKITDNEEMDNMVESIKEIGVKVPILVRPKQNGGYEMVAGHRRNYATKKAGLDGIPAIVREMTDEEATIIMVDSNIQREKILPSEKAFAYKMKMEALSHQGKKETSRQVGEKLVSADVVGKDSGESGRQVQRYIRLTELIKELLDMVDIGKISFSPAVEISYLSKEEQNLLLCYIKKYDATPSQSQAIYLKKLSQEGKLTTDKLEEIMSAEKPNQKPKYNIHYDRFEKYLPRDVVTEKEVEDFLFKCVEEHHRRLKQRQMAR